MLYARGAPRSGHCHRNSCFSSLTMLEAPEQKHIIIWESGSGNIYWERTTFQTHAYIFGHRTFFDPQTATLKQAFFSSALFEGKETLGQNYSMHCPESHSLWVVGKPGFEPKTLVPLSPCLKSLLHYLQNMLERENNLVTFCHALFSIQTGLPSLVSSLITTGYWMNHGYIQNSNPHSKGEDYPIDNIWKNVPGVLKAISKEEW